MQPKSIIIVPFVEQLNDETKKESILWGLSIEHYKSFMWKDKAEVVSGMVKSSFCDPPNHIYNTEKGDGATLKCLYQNNKLQAEP